MNETDSQQDQRADQAPDETADASGPGESAAGQPAEGLREQIAALRKRVKDAQDVLRDHHRRQEGRSFKR